MPPMGREVAVAQSAPPPPPPMQPPMGREVAVHNSAPAADDADLVKKHRRRAAKARAAADAGPPPRADAEAERARALHDKLERQARSDEAARLAAPPRPSPVYERVASKLSATRRDQDAALEEEAAMWRERALRAEAAMAKPPESPAVATMFQQHAASLREEVKATIEAALKEDRPAATPIKDDRPPPLEAAPPSPPSPPSRSKGPTTRRPRRCRPGARPRRKLEGPRGLYGEDLRGRRRLRAAHGEAARPRGEARGRPGAHREGAWTSSRPPSSRALVPQTFRPPAGAAAAAYMRLRAPFVDASPRAGLPADEPGPAGWWAGVTRVRGLLNSSTILTFRLRTFAAATCAYRKGGGGTRRRVRTGSERAR